MQNTNGNNNLQLLGDNNSIHVDNNYVSSLRIEPKDIELKATVNSTLFTWAIIFLDMFVFVGIGKLLRHVYPELNFNILFFIAVIATLFCSIVSVLLLDKLLYKTRLWNVKYKDGVLTYEGKEYKFYEDIWDIKYKPSIFKIGGTLTLYVINPSTKLPFREDIKFSYDGRAKYVYDSFHSEERRKKYLTNI